MNENPFASYLQKIEPPKQTETPAPTNAPAPEQKQEANPFGGYLQKIETEGPEPGGPIDARPIGEIVRHAPKPEQPMEWSEVGKQAIQNIPQSAVAYGQSLITPFTQPKETAEALGQIGKGAYSKIAGAFGAQQNEEKKAQDEAAINAIGRFYADRYGSVEGFKTALANDPVGVLADASSVLTLGGGAAARVPGVIGQVGKVATSAGNVIDPLMMAGKGVKGVTKATTATLSLPEWWTTGASLSSLNTAAKAGLENNKTFISHLTGAVKPEDTVRRIEAVHSKIADDARQVISKRLGDIEQVPMSYTPVYQAIQDALPRVALNGTITDKKGYAALNEVFDVVNQFNKNPQIPATVGNLQELKKSVRRIGQDFPVGTEQWSVVNSVEKAIRNEIAALPNGVGQKYLDAMKGWEQRTKELNEIRQNFLQGKSDATKLRKVLGVKDDTFKRNLLEELAKYDPEIPYAVAGMELSPVFPSGLRGQIAGIVSGSGAFMAGVPQAIGGMLVHSPRAMGAAQYGIGQIGGIAPRMIESAPMLRQIPFQAGRAEQELEREGRANGGRIGVGSIAQRLVASAEKAHKYHQKTTEEILDAPDEAVVKALAVAKKHI
jgi:hypothetical protein